MSMLERVVCRLQLRPPLNRSSLSTWTIAWSCHTLTVLSMKRAAPACLPSPLSPATRVLRMDPTVHPPSSCESCRRTQDAVLWGNRQGGRAARALGAESARYAQYISDGENAEEHVSSFLRSLREGARISNKQDGKAVHREKAAPISPPIQLHRWSLFLFISGASANGQHEIVFVLCWKMRSLRIYRCGDLQPKLGR